MQATQPGRRPLGITILAVLAVLGAILSGIVGSDLLASGTTVAGTAPALGRGFATIVGVLMVGIGVLNLVLAYGLWALKAWAWPLAVGVWAATIVLSILQFMNNTGLLVSMALSVVIAAAILYYLFTPQVKAAFGRT